jgi:hypothetical protein
MSTLPMLKLKRCSGDELGKELTLLTGNSASVGQNKLKLYFEPFGAVWETIFNAAGDPVPCYAGDSIRVFGNFEDNPDWVNQASHKYDFAYLSGKWEHASLGWIFRGNEQWTNINDIRDQLISKFGIRRWEHINEDSIHEHFSDV